MTGGAHTEVLTVSTFRMITQCRLRFIGAFAVVKLIAMWNNPQFLLGGSSFAFCATDSIQSHWVGIAIHQQWSVQTGFDRTCRSHVDFSLLFIPSLPKQFHVFSDSFNNRNARKVYLSKTHVFSVEIRTFSDSQVVAISSICCQMKRPHHAHQTPWWWWCYFFVNEMKT